VKPRRRVSKSPLRVRAERILAARPLPPPRTTKEEAVQELQIQQVELELQVEELRRTELELQVLRGRYKSLYDEAPVGYLTLDENNLVTQANRAAAAMLGSPGVRMVGRRFSGFLDATSRSTFYAVIADVRKDGGPRLFDVRLPPGAKVDGGRRPVWVQLTLVVERLSGELRITLVDVTGQRTAEKELRELADGLITLQERERSAIAEALHDDAGQQLTYLCMLLDRARESGAALDGAGIEEASGVARKVLQRIRVLSASLTPAELSRVGLPGALQSMIQEYTARTRIPVTFTPAGDFGRLSLEVSLSAYRIVQEALTNTARYAEAGTVRVNVLAGDSRLRVEIADDGKGFDPKNTVTSLGLLGMRERARTAHGHLDISSSPGKGTRIVFEMPGERRSRPR
jgi:PAS domain S-box-containing protein